LRHATEAAKAAIGRTIDELRADGVPVGSLRPCEAEARVGTRLGGCAKYYIPQPDGRWGAVFTIEAAGSTLTLLLLEPMIGRTPPSASV
jgi:hypothetical protein